jgi:hypothetical protein
MLNIYQKYKIFTLIIHIFTIIKFNYYDYNNLIKVHDYMFGR